MTASDGPGRPALIAALVVAVGAILFVLVVAANQGPNPVPIAALPAPESEGPDCARLIAALPDDLGEYERAPTVDPTPAGTAAWAADTSADPVILRCGLDRPADFVIGTPLQMVDDVSWFQVSDAGRSTWFAVDRPVYVALTLPQDSGSAPIQELSRVISSTLEAQAIDPAPVS